MGPGQFSVGRVGLAIFGLDLENFPWKSLFFPFGSKKSHRVGSKSTSVKDGSASYLMQVKNMLGSVQGPSLLTIWLWPWLRLWCVKIFFRLMSKSSRYFSPTSQHVFIFYPLDDLKFHVCLNTVKIPNIGPKTTVYTNTEKKCYSNVLNLNQF